MAENSRNGNAPFNLRMTPKKNSIGKRSAATSAEKRRFNESLHEAEELGTDLKRLRLASETKSNQSPAPLRDVINHPRESVARENSREFSFRYPEDFQEQVDGMVEFVMERFIVDVVSLSHDNNKSGTDLELHVKITGSEENVDKAATYIHDEFESILAANCTSE